MKLILAILLSLLFYSGVAQTSNKKKVLVVPITRFQFASEFDISEIATKNGIPENKVFLQYQKTLENAFVEYADENFEFVKADPVAIHPIKKHIKYKYSKVNGKHYNVVELKTFKENAFIKLLEYHKADFVIFITWYDIQKESFTRAGKKSKRAKYAGHYIDYDIYNLFKQRVIGAGKVKAEAPIPNDAELAFTLLRLKELKLAYANFINKVVEQLNRPLPSN